MRFITLVLAVVAMAVAAPAIADKGGNPNAGKGNAGEEGGTGNGNREPGGTCTANDTVVAASGLPTDALVNFMVTDSSGSSGWVLGYTSTGSWSVSVSSPSGPTTYAFVSRTYGPNGTKYDVFASCDA